MACCRGKTALVTNASAAPGAAAATALATAGALVLVHDRHSTANAAPIVDPILSSGGVAKAIAAEISTAEGQQQLAQQAHGIVGDRLDVLVLNVDSDASSVPMLLIELLLPILNRGSSVTFLYPASLYSASKAAQPQIATQMRHLAAALKPRGIRVNAIEIGRSHTSAQAAGSRDVGDVITRVASNESSEITGTTIRAHIKANTGRGKVSAGATSSGSRQ